jgi:hypothetical protein
MRPRPGSIGSGVPVEDLGDDARDLAPDAFRERHGDGFLLITAARVTVRTGDRTTCLQLDGEGDPDGRTADLAIVIYPLRGPQGVPADIVTLGRESRHDVVIPDASVSRFQAFLKRDGSGRFRIQDVESTNGTAVNGTSVPSRGAGDPVVLKPGDTVRLGQVEATFTDAHGLQSFVRSTVG